jgi:EpsI family protein
MEIGGRAGKKNEMESIYLDALKLSDYILADYVGTDGQAVNFYVAYYDSQRKGASVHSPKSCLPGGGWRIKEFGQVAVDGAGSTGASISVNRAIIQMGDVRQLVYYWFQQRGRVMTNEYLVKWFLFWDALTKQRTDGALVRITTIVPPEQDISKSDKLLQEFARDVGKGLDRYIPE